MIRHSGTRTCALITAAALTAWVATAQQPKKVDNNALRSAAKNGEDWVTHGHDYAETHFSPLKQIDTTNVKRLEHCVDLEAQAPAGSSELHAGFKRSDVRHLGLGRDVRHRCADWSIQMAPGPRDSTHRNAGHLLHSLQSRSRDVQRSDL